MKYFNLIYLLTSLVMLFFAIRIYVEVRRSTRRQRKAIDDLIEERRKLLREGRMEELKEHMKLNRYFNN